MLVCSLATAHAYTFTVTNTGDDDGTGDCVDGGGACSLRQAINASEVQPGADQINFDPTVFSTDQTITVGSRMADINEDLSIQGPTTTKLTISCAGGDLYAFVSRGGTLTLSNLTVSGFTEGLDTENLAASNCSFEYQYGGVMAWTSSTVTNCRFANCNSTLEGYNATVSNSVFFGGSSGPYINGSLLNCTICNVGLGVEEQTGAGPLTVRNCTIANCVQAIQVYGSDPLIVQNCILAGNTDNTATRYDFATNAETHPVLDSSNVVGTAAQAGLELNAGLPFLKLNGGTTETIALLPGSPAIDLNAHTSVATDQRGVSRPQGTKDDAGAYEYVVVDTAPPGVTVTRPTANQSISPLAWVNGFVTGTATDNQGVASVVVKFYKGPFTDRWYWDGSQFVRTATTLAATLTSPGANSTTWTLSGPDFPEAAEIGTGNYSVTVNAIDGAGNISNVVTKNFVLSAGDVTPPNVGIDQPQNTNPLTAGQFLRPGVRGVITDDTAVGGVTVKFISNIGGLKKYWSGSSFVNSQVDAPVTVPDAGSAVSYWNLDPLPSESDLVPGSYGLVVSGTDAAGNTSATTILYFKIVVETTPPTGVITNPASSVNVTAADFANSVVRGTANDDVQLGSVAVKLYSNINGAKTYWDGTSFQSLAVNAPVLFSIQNFTTGYWQITNMPSAADLSPGSYGVNLVVKDAAGNVSSTISRTFNIVAEVNPPTGAILYPGNVQSVTAADFAANTVNGTASDDGAVAAVTVKLSRVNGGVKEYWGSSGWQNTSTLAPCTVPNIGQASTTWQLSTTPSVSDVQTLYSLTVTIIDHVGNTKVLIRNVNIVPDTSAPVVHVYAPVTNGNYSPEAFTNLRIQGDASDDTSIARVSVKLYRTLGGYRIWWDGSSWVYTSAEMPRDHDIGAANNLQWLAIDMPPADQLDPDTYGVTVTAWDPSGNRTIVSRSFRISNDQDLPIVTFRDPVLEP